MDPSIEQARNESQNAARQAGEAQAYGMTLPDMLNDALTKKFSANNPQVQQREGLLTNYMNAVTQAPLDVTHTSAGGNANVIYTPLEQANLIQQRRSVPLSALSTSNYLLGLSQGGIQNVIDATGRAYGAGTQRMATDAQLKRQSYVDLVDEASRKAKQEMEMMKYQEGIRQFNENLALQKQQEARLGRDSGTGDGNYDIYTGNSYLEPMPRKPIAIGTISPGGRWYQTNDGMVDLYELQF